MKQAYLSGFAPTLVVLSGLFLLPACAENQEAGSASSATEAPASNQDASVVPVTVDNFVRAETALSLDRTLALSGGVNKWAHLKEPTRLDQQPVIRMNRDTLYSGVVVDLSKGATLTIPEAGDRYLSVQVLNEDHYTPFVFSEPGTYELSTDNCDTQYVQLSARTLVDASDPEDIRAANALQEQLKVEVESARPYTHPNYDLESYKEIHAAVLALGRSVPDARDTFGSKQDVDAVRHFLGTAWGWGGLPDEETQYLNVEPNLPVGSYQITVRDVPVDAFWSISVYNREGYFELNEYDAYSMNNISGTPNPDGSYTIHFGGDPDSVNFLPISEGWNYSVRMYRPRAEILDGSWTFPDVEPVK